jgi:mannose-P-dolichol utilization defect protein 1
VCGIQVINFLLGSLARVFTTLQEVNDPLILYGFLAGFALNLVLAVQVAWYWNAPATKTKTKTGKGKKANKPITAEKVNAGETPSYAKVASSTAKSPSTRRRG